MKVHALWERFHTAIESAQNRGMKPLLRAANVFGQQMSQTERYSGKIYPN